MKVLVVGSVPPPGGGRRDALLHEVLRLQGEGHEVEIVSLDPLAASHRYLAAPGVPAAVEVGFLARRADAMVLQIEPGLPVRDGAGRAERAASLMAMTRALRGRHATLRLVHSDDLPGGMGGRPAIEMWTAAAGIEVGDESLRADLAAILGPIGDRVSVIDIPAVGASLPADAGLDGWGDGADVTAAHVSSIVRRRAAAEREALAHRRLPDGADGGLAPRVSQWQWLPSPGAGVPDLGPLRREGGDEDRSDSRRLRSPSPARRPGLAFSLRGGASRLLAAAERRPATRSIAHLARLSWVELRGAMRRAA